MNRRSEQEIWPVILVAAGIATAALAGSGRALLAGLLADVLSWLPVLCGLLALILAAGFAARVVARRRCLGSRARLVVLAPDSFDPSAEAVLRFAGQLARVRRSLAPWLDLQASAVRILLDVDQAGRPRYSLIVPQRALTAVHAALGNYPRVQTRLLEAQPAADDQTDLAGGEASQTQAAEVAKCPTDAADKQPRPAEQQRGYVVRAELRLARASSQPLARPGLDPDPLQPLMAVLAEVERRYGESAQVAIDLLPCTAAARGRLRGRLLRTAARPAASTASSPAAAGPLGLLGAGGVGRRAASEAVAQRAEREQLAGKLLRPEPLFGIQILLRCQAPSRERALSRMQALLSCFDAFADANSYRVAGVRLAGLAFLGSDLPGVRGRFDRRMRTGRFAPARRGYVSAQEIAWALKPPTKRCQVPGLLRLGAAVNPPPRELPSITEENTSGLLPLGQVEDRRGQRTVGVRLNDTFFTYITGRSRWGKTELAICQFLHLVRAGHGGLFLDPHEDAIKRIKSCLTEEQHARRILELDLVGEHSYQAQPGWNLFAARELSPQAAEGRVQAIVDSFASALQWGERNNRALMLTTQAAAALIELSRKLPADTQPTIFQIPTLLGNQQWLAAVLSHLSAPRQQFFKERFPRLADEAITPVTNLIDRLRSCTQLAALLGAQTSSYDIAAAMDQQRIVLACPGAGGATDRLIANLLVFDLLHAAKRRAHQPADQRRPFHVFLDEVQTYDGAASGNLAALLEQTAKYGIRACLLNQNPERLTRDTLQALTTNRSHLIVTALNSHAAALIAREWAGDPDPAAITGLPRYTFLAQVTHQGQLSTPFLFHGIPVEQRLPGVFCPDQLQDIQPLIDQASGRTSTKQTIEDLDTLDQRIHAHLTGTQDQQSPSSSRGVELPQLPAASWEQQ
jgi:hypothetical protein